LRSLDGAEQCVFLTAHLENEAWWDGLDPADLTLFLGLFYHLADPILVMRRAMSLTSDTIVVDTEVADEPEPLLRIRRRDPAEPTTSGSGLSTGLRIVPTSAAVVDLLHDGGFQDVRVLEATGEMPDDYRSGLRVSVIAHR
jgi:hypothetical protein